jgi:hypothetical protein
MLHQLFNSAHGSQKFVDRKNFETEGRVRDLQGCPVSLLGELGDRICEERQMVSRFDRVPSRAFPCLRRTSPRSYPVDVTSLLINRSPCSSDQSGRNPDAERGSPHCLRERHAFPNHSTQCSARCAVWSLRPDPDADTENPFHIELD